jgi:hypothetical protein
MDIDIVKKEAEEKSQTPEESDNEGKTFEEKKFEDFFIQCQKEVVPEVEIPAELEAEEEAEEYNVISFNGASIVKEESLDGVSMEVKLLKIEPSGLTQNQDICLDIVDQMVSQAIVTSDKDLSKTSLSLLMNYGDQSNSSEDEEQQGEVKQIKREELKRKIEVFTKIQSSSESDSDISSNVSTM